MPAEKFFEKFPKVTYSNNEIVDITRRVALLDKISTNPYVFYPYEITAEERADQLSYRYYSDPYMSWLIYISNKITDPYYEWYMHAQEFTDFIVKKYGTEEIAKSKTKFYRNDWANNSTINQSAYNALSGPERKYWEPYVKNDYKPATTYKRKEEDWTITTNKVLSYAVANSSNFIVDEICTIVFDDQRTGKGQLISAANNLVVLQHISGYHHDDEIRIYGNESKANTTLTSVTVVANNLTDEETVYWKPVSYYEYEYEKNEYYKTIRVIDSNFKYVAVDNLKDLLEE